MKKESGTGESAPSSTLRPFLTVTEIGNLTILLATDHAASERWVVGNGAPS